MSIISRTLSHAADLLSERSDALSNALSPYTAPSTQLASGGVDYDEPHSKASKAIASVRSQLRRGIPPVSLREVGAIIDAIRHTNSIDDRKLLLEDVVVVLSELPEGNFKTTLQNEFVQLLYHDLSHPPATYIGQQHVWRAPDGSDNNVNLPALGKAGNNYSRSVQQQHPLPPSQLPDPGLLFDSLLKRDKEVKHPGGLSAMMFSFAALVIHTCFRTSQDDWSVNETTSYVDLSPLYGWTSDTQKSVRAHNGRGYLKNDVFAEDRIVFLPPAAGAVLVLLNRNHNYIADKLLEHNENGRFNSDLSKLTSDQLIKQDDELFNVARLVNCGWFGNMVFSDYFSTILGLVRYGRNWYLDPFEQIRKSDHTLVPRGQGNAVTVEFNLLYRWHSTLSQLDEKWISGVFADTFTKPVSELTPMDFGIAMQQVKQKLDAQGVENWEFGNLTRGKDGKFKDEDLAGLLAAAISEPASAFKARGIPEVMRVVETMTISQSRRWGVCSLNEFRKFLGLKPYTKFIEWNRDTTIAETAERIYGDIENLELHVGLQAEEAKPIGPGAGLCPGYTISRAILADAIALTRGDRFFTTDMTPYNLTSWGFSDCQRDNSDNSPAFGGMLGRLLLRTLPDQFAYNSVYTWFPLMTPDSMKTNLTTLGLADRYSFETPSPKAAIAPISNYTQVTAAIKSDSLAPTYSERAVSVGLDKGFFIASKDVVKAQQIRNKVEKIFFSNPDVLQKHTDIMVRTTLILIKQRSFTVVGNNTLSVDIVRDVLNVMPLHWVAQLTGLDLKTAENPRGSYVEVELMQFFQEIYSYIFFEGDASKQMQLEDAVKEHCEELLRSIKGHGKSGGLISTIIHTLFGGKSGKNDLQSKLYAAGFTEEEVPNILFSIAVGVSAEYSQALIHVVNLYLDAKNKDEADKIKALVGKSDVGTSNLLEGYVREALRIDPPIPGVHRHATADISLAGANFKSGGRYYLSIANANGDPSVFPNPTKIDPTRPKDAYLIGDSALRVLGEDFIVKPIAQVLKAIFALPNIRRGPGVSGKLNRSDYEAYGTKQHEYMNRKQQLTLWSQSMIIQYDEKH